jgi:alpha-D-ribose 1-methylphosphonate 5-triphosphate synthase subunit PhnG
MKLYNGGYEIMDASMRTKILSGLTVQQLKEWTEPLERKGHIQVMKAPGMGLVMMRAMDSVTSEKFNAGEVLISECTVSLNGRLGYGAVMGRDPEKARSLALMDALFHSDDSECREMIVEVEERLRVYRAEREQREKREFRLINGTVSDFSRLDDAEEEEVARDG